MRLISQKGTIDIPYENVALVVRSHGPVGWGIDAVPIASDSEKPGRYTMATYSKKELAIFEAKRPAAMLECNENPFYGRKTVFYVFREEEDVQEEWDRLSKENADGKI